MTPLSKREQFILDNLAKGLRNKEIAEVSQVTEKTVKFHLTNIYKKLGVKSRGQAIIKKLGSV